MKSNSLEMLWWMQALTHIHSPIVTYTWIFLQDCLKKKHTLWAHKFENKSVHSSRKLLTSFLQHKYHSMTHLFEHLDSFMYGQGKPRQGVSVVLYLKPDKLDARVVQKLLQVLCSTTRNRSDLHLYFWKMLYAHQNWNFASWLVLPKVGINCWEWFISSIQVFSWLTTKINIYYVLQCRLQVPDFWFPW